MMRRLAFLLLAVVLAAPAWAAQNVRITRHNLSTSGTATITSGTITQVCVFCHTPHNASPLAPLWNRQMSTVTYPSVYDSTTLQSIAKPDQPTGKSKLCLACHDGTVALGAFVNPPTGVVNDLASTFLTGRANLDTDLSDDHPISFDYLAGLNEMADPATIDLPLEVNQLQCTTCHDPHEADLQPFLHKTAINGQLCTTCHVRGGGTGATAWDWATSSHATSTATPTGATPWPERRPEWRGSNVAENSCFNCHTPHTAATPARLIKGDALGNQEENTCYLCHDGTVAATDVEADFQKSYRHPVETTPNISHDAASIEDPLTMPFHVECADCHNPHAVKDEPPMISFNPLATSDPHTTPPLANARIKGVKGIDVNGSEKQNLEFQYELCFKCHGLGLAPCDGQRCPTTQSRGHVRVDTRPDNTRTPILTNIRDRVNPTTPGLQSYHPLVENNQANNDGSDPRGIEGVPSLRQDLPIEINDVDAFIYCTDCHSSDVSPAAGGTGPSGPHGSTWEGLLTQQYTFNTDPPNNAAFYALCYKCHDQGRLLSDLSGFPHGNHIQSRGGACMLCHDPHGAIGLPEHNARLIQFLWQADGIFVVDCIRQKGGGQQPCETAADDPDPRGPIWIDDTTAGNEHRGLCYLECHGSAHDNKNY